MCYPKPGPRCSAHAKQRLLAAKKQLNIAKYNADVDRSRHRDLLIKRQEATLEEKQEGKQEIRDLQYKIIKHNHTIHDAYIEVNDKQDIYDTTPEGLTALEKSIEEASSDEANNTPDSYDDVRWLQSRLNKAKETRETQLRLLRLAKHVASTSGQSLTITEDTPQSVMDDIIETVGKQNIYIGRNTILTSISEGEQKLTQNRVNKLLSYFTTTNSDVRITSDIVKEFEEMGATPGFKLIGKGAYRAAYRDVATGKVIKIPLQYKPGENAHEARKITQNEQYGYAVLELKELDDLGVEYVTTEFYNGGEDNVPVVVQPMLDEETYYTPREADTILLAEKLSGVPGIWDIHEGNIMVNKETGTRYPSSSKTT